MSAATAYGASLTVNVSPLGSASAVTVNSVPVTPGVPAPGLSGTVAVAATPNTGFAFGYWQGAVADPNAMSTTMAFSKAFFVRT